MLMFSFEKMVEQSHLWEVGLIIVVLYLIINPSILKAISKIKVGDLEIEIQNLKGVIAEGEFKINELESEIEGERRRFEDLLEKIDPNTNLAGIAGIRQMIKSNAKNINEMELLGKYLSLDASPDELNAAAISIRERRPVLLATDLIGFLETLSRDKNLGGFRLNTIWTQPVRCI